MARALAMVRRAARRRGVEVRRWLIRRLAQAVLTFAIAVVLMFFLDRKSVV